MVPLLGCPVFHTCKFVNVVRKCKVVNVIDETDWMSIACTESIPLLFGDVNRNTEVDQNPLELTRSQCHSVGLVEVTEPLSQLDSFCTNLYDLEKEQLLYLLKDRPFLRKLSPLAD